METLAKYELMNKKHELIKSDIALEFVEIIAFYFGASSCKHCHDCTSKLKKMYDVNLKRNTKIQIVFVCLDTDKKKFSESCKEQGDWLFIPYKCELIEMLRVQYSITSIPRIIVVRKDTGEIIANHGYLELKEKGVNVIVAWGP